MQTFLDSLYLLLVVFLIALFALYILPHAVKKIQILLLENTCTKSGLVAITFDDGPDQKFTPRMLDLLREKRIPATFFVVGNKLLEPTERDLVLRALAAGHEVGSHSYRHLHSWKNPLNATLSDTVSGILQLRQLIGSVEFFRPPFGKWHFVTMMKLYSLKITPAWWTLDSGDTWAKLPELDRRISKILKAGGGVVLLHDRSRSSKAREQYVFDFVEKLANEVEARGLRLVRFSEIERQKG